MERKQFQRGGHRVRLVPDILPLPQTTKELFGKLLQRKGLLHPVYVLSKFVQWHEGWNFLPPKDSDKSSPGVKPLAFDLALKSLNSSEMQKLSMDVLERRRRWLASFVEMNRVRVLRATARTDVIVNLVSRSPLELGLALHHVYGFPILPGSALKGLARRSVRENGDRLYGTQEWSGDVAILDGLPLCYKIRRDIMTPHFPKWYQGKADAPDDTDSPTPIPFLSVAADAIFEIALIARRSETASQNLDAVTQDLGHGLEELGLGAKTAAGYGVFELGDASKTVLAETHSGQTEEAKTAPPLTRSEFDEKLSRIEALPPSPAGEIGEFVDWCLGLEDPQEKAVVAKAIVAKMGDKLVRDKARNKEKWRRIREIAQSPSAE